MHRMTYDGAVRMALRACDLVAAKVEHENEAADVVFRVGVSTCKRVILAMDEARRLKLGEKETLARVAFVLNTVGSESGGLGSQD